VYNLKKPTLVPMDKLIRSSAGHHIYGWWAGHYEKVLKGEGDGKAI